MQGLACFLHREIMDRWLVVLGTIGQGYGPLALKSEPSIHHRRDVDVWPMIDLIDGPRPLKDWGFEVWLIGAMN